MNISDVMTEIEKKENFFSGKETAEADFVKQIESMLNVALPADYREFVETYGFAIWFGHRICGVAALNECNTLHYTQIARAGNLVHAHDGLVVMPYEGGGYYILNCSGEQEGKVILVGSDSNSILEEWASFTEFANYLLSVSP